MSRYVRSAGVAVDLGGSGATLSDQWASPLLPDTVLTATSTRKSVAPQSNAIPHTPGGWVEVDSSLSADAGGLWIFCPVTPSTNGVDSSTLIEIGTGGSGSEVVWATASIGYRAAGSHPIIIPGFIAMGSRVAIRLRSARTLFTLSSTFVNFFATKSSAVPPAPVTLGADTAVSRGVTLTPPGSLNTKGNWTEIAASTPAALGALALMVQGAGSITITNSAVLIDIGIGGAGAETVLIPDVYFTGATGEEYNPRSPLIYGVDVPAGSRLSARYARADTVALDLFLVGA